jgi:tRNA-5-methyluridine54 2-sulfurtransferase
MTKSKQNESVLKKNLSKSDKAFIKKFETNVANTIKKYKLANKKEKVIVACSGGKDSTAVLYMMHKLGYNIEGLIVDLFIGKWSEDNRDNINGFCKKLGIKLHVISMREMFGSSICYIRSNIQTKINLKNCAICGVIKRWLLNKESRVRKAKKVATGHNLDDQAETLLMNMIKGNVKLSLGQTPLSGVIKDKKLVPRIKPLFFLTNAEVRRYSELMNFPVLYDPCPCSLTAFRRKVRNSIKKLEKDYPNIKVKMVEGFLKNIKELRKNNKQIGKIRYCKICKEPSRNEVCKTCELIKILRMK